MSGPKDYIVLYAAARAMAVSARRQAAKSARQRATRERMRLNRERAAKKAAALAEKRAKTAQKAAELASKRAAQEAAALAKKRAETARKAAELAGKRADAAERNTARVNAKSANVREIAERSIEARGKATAEELERRRLEASSLPVSDVQSVSRTVETADQAETDDDPAGAADELSAPSGQQSEAAEPVHPHVVDQLRDRLSELMAWRDELVADDAVQQFHRVAADAWKATADACLAEESEMTSENIETMCRDARRLHEEAGERQARFTERNGLLRDVMDSLKEIGFFVGDPAYADPGDPAGPVLIKATRGSEVMTASIDLSQGIQSVWDGLADERCKSSFFDYVDRMQTRGVEVRADRPDLQQRPILHQQSAKDLPRGQQIGGGT